MEELNKIRLFYFESNYQFLISLSIVISLPDKDELGVKYSNFFIDATCDGIVYKRNDLLCKNFNLEVYRVESKGFYFNMILAIKKSLKFKFKKENSFFYFFSNRSPIANKISSYYKKEQTFLVEEGLSMYRDGRYMTFKSNIKKLIKELLVSTLTFSHFSDTFGRTNYANSVMLRYPNLYKSNQKGNPKNVLKLPELKVLRPVSEILMELFGNNSSFPDFTSSHPKMIFFGQPLSELGLIESEKELVVINEVKTLLLSFGIDLIIKAHPKDKINKYININCPIIDAFIPAEIISFQDVNVVGVLSFYSTAAINTAVDCNVPVLFLYKMLETIDLNINYPDFVQVVSPYNLKPFIRALLK
jgi:hypothetical protein